MAQFPLLLTLLVLCNSPFHFPLTYLETLLWRDVIPSTLAPGCSPTGLPFPIPSPSPPHPLPILNSRPPGVFLNQLCALLRQHRDPGFQGPEQVLCTGGIKRCKYCTFLKWGFYIQG